ncbi:MAG TPA: hypothetical protein PLE45_07675 [Spirochaetota bacterium]|nr:hypothetical protein [Spirochaetota bacterium]HOL58049.1 hypothetical protein [Spirochaetota bacterium]HPP05687.1 hypothetical protein [Spirochaetota bacterium]
MKLKVIFKYILFIFVFSCSKNYYNISSNIKLEILEDEIYSKFITFKDSRIVYSDEKTLSIKYYDIKNKKSYILDKVDNEPKINQMLGKHTYFILDEKEYLFYIDVINEKRQNYKLITKDINKENWQVFLNDLTLSDFNGFLYNENIFILGYSNCLNFYYLVNDQLKEVEFKEKEKFQNREMKNIRCFLKDNQLFLFFISHNQLFVVKFILDRINGNFSIRLLGEENKIHENVDCYDYAFYGDIYYIVFYDSSKYELNIYNSKDKLIRKIGYFLNIFSLKLIKDKEDNFIFYTSIDLKKNNSPQYYISLIYNNSYIWKEFILSYFDYPVFNIEAVKENEKIKIAGAGNALFLFDFDLKKIKK